MKYKNIAAYYAWVPESSINLNLFSWKENLVSVNYAKQNSTTLGMLIIIVIAIVAIKEEKKGNDNVGVAWHWIREEE